MKKTTIMSVLALIALMATVPLMAQVVYEPGDIGDLESNTSKATAGLFGNDVDDFMSFHNYSGVLAGGAKRFGFVTGRQIINAQGETAFVGDLGFAAAFGGIYLGVWFRGNIARHTGDDYDVESKTVSIRNETINDVILTIKTTTYNEKWLESANRLELLAGVAGHGIRVGFFESVAGDLSKGSNANPVTETDNRNGAVTVANETVDYKNSQGYLKPYVGWGSGFNILGMNIYPYADLGLTIRTDKLIDNTVSYTNYFGVRNPEYQTGIKGRRNGYIRPSIGIGASLDLPGSKGSVSLVCSLDLDIYSNDYSDSGVSGKAKGTVEWEGSNNVIKDYDTATTITVDNVTLEITEQKKFSSAIELGYTITGEPFDNLKLGFSAGIPISFGSESGKEYSKEFTTTVERSDLDRTDAVTTRTEETTFKDGSKTSTFGACLNFSLGASYAIIKDRFTVNAGIKASPAGFSRKKVTHIPDSNKSIKTTTETRYDGSVTKDEKEVTPGTALTDFVQVYDTWNQWSASVHGGFTFYFNPRIALDLGANAGAGSEGFSLGAANLNVIFTFKF